MGNAIEMTFGRSRVLLPVIHAESARQALRNAQLARDAGCAGVFLINHSMGSRELLDVHRVVTAEIPGWWVGVNCLDLAPEEVFRVIGNDVGGVWVDNALTDERLPDQPAADAVLAARAAAAWHGLYFGGTAFKYQRPVEDLRSAARIAARYMDVVTTSGPGTGLAAEVDKIRAMRDALAETPLAIASGITPANVSDYLPMTDAFLVATGISSSFTEFDPVRMQELEACIDEHAGAATERAGVTGPPLGTPERAPSLVCFVCEWNEGRSAHLELSVRRRLREAGATVAVTSAGLRQGGTISALRKDFLLARGVPAAELDAHRSSVFDPTVHGTGLVLVAERRMAEELLDRHPELAGRVMTVRAAVAGLPQDDDTLTAAEAHIEDAAGHTDAEKLELYAELEELADAVARRLTGDSWA